MRRAMLLLSLVLSIGCLGSDPVATLDGTYTLRSANGAALPYTLSQGAGTKVELLDDAYMIYLGMTFSQSGRIRTTVNGQPTTANQTRAGNFALEGHSLKFRSGTGGTERIGNLTGNTLTIIEVGVTYVYNK